MSMTFQKRQKELKRQEKQRAKAERREQRKAAKRAEQSQVTSRRFSDRGNEGEARGEVGKIDSHH
jgi:hypothetical protein